MFDLFRLVHGLASCLNSCWFCDVSVLNVDLDLDLMFCYTLRWVGCYFGGLALLGLFDVVFAGLAG